MASSGPNNPSASSQSGTGTSWTNLGNAYASDNSYATCTIVGFASSKLAIYTGFGFSIPSGATIDGIVAEMERKDASGTFVDLAVKLTKDGTTVVGTSLASGLAWPASDAYRTYGSSSNLWGTTWTDTEVNASTFGFTMTSSHNTGKSTDTGSVDHVRITIHYTGGSGSSSNSLLMAGD